MKLLVEKALFLGSLEIFADLSGETLGDLAAVAKKSEHPAGTVIFARGDRDARLYAIVRGAVRAGDGEREAALLGEREAFGVLAALDRAPRPLSATVHQDATLFSIESDDLYDLMSDNIQLAQSVIKYLCRRCRYLIHERIPAGCFEKGVQGAERE